MGSTSPPAIPVADDCKPPKKRTTWCSDQQSVQSHGGISALPDDILIKILSLMTIREAALTDCLSTRWRHLWKKVKNVILDKHNFGMQTIANPNIHENSDLLNSEATEFVHKVNRVLHHHSGNGIEKFEVKFPLSSTHASDLDRWIAFAAASSAEKIFISLHDKHDIGAPQQSEPYKFPLKEFADMRDYCWLRVLFLSMCSLETVPTNLSGFSHLESLSLNCVSIVDEVFLNIASSCHALRELWLKKCNQLIHVRISNSQLVAMEVNGCKSLISINVHAKKLEEFSYMGHKVYDNIRPLRPLNIIWPEDFTAEALHTIRIGGFSGEPELVDLLFFLLGRSPVLKTLLVYTQRRRYQGYNRWQRYRWTPEDMKRRYYARGVAFTLLAPKVPPTVKLTIS
ncbi:unnamed protein product [Urochloa decumbens]|uniref:F-box domain-containing protein n=1 Tax=Urochloa decumbens TaxID=240449 RepID=A0ABC9FNI3_9POAL